MTAHTQTVEFEHSSAREDDAKWTTEVQKQDPHSWIWFLQIHQHGMNVDGISTWPTRRQALEWVILCLTASLSKLFLRVDVHWHTDNNVYLEAFRNITSGQQQVEGWSEYIVHTLWWSPFAVHLPLPFLLSAMDALNCYNEKFNNITDSSKCGKICMYHC